MFTFLNNASPGAENETECKGHSCDVTAAHIWTLFFVYEQSCVLFRGDYPFPCSSVLRYNLCYMIIILYCTDVLIFFIVIKASFL